MKPLAAFAPEARRGIRVVLADIDDTITLHGKLPAASYAALERLRAAGFIVVPVTGRPAGWCDHIARFWPVHAVVGENGAFTFFMEGGVRRRLDTPGSSKEPRPALSKLGEKIRAKYPKAAWASDQAYREHDLAIDICEDVPAWKDADVKGLLELCKAEGAHAKLSSIHVNAWFGDYDKRAGLEAWVKAGTPGAKGLPKSWDQWLFIGDSPNDEPLFEFFPNAVGVANLKEYQLKHAPRWITSAESGAGFCEMATRLTRASTKRYGIPNGNT